MEVRSSAAKASKLEVAGSEALAPPPPESSRSPTSSGEVAAASAAVAKALHRLHQLRERVAVVGVMLRHLGYQFLLAVAVAVELVVARRHLGYWLLLAVVVAVAVVVVRHLGYRLLPKPPLPTVAVEVAVVGHPPPHPQRCQMHPREVVEVEAVRRRGPPLRHHSPRQLLKLQQQDHP